MPTGDFHTQAKRLLGVAPRTSGQVGFMTSQEYPHDTKSASLMTGQDILLYRLTQAEKQIADQENDLKLLQKKVEMYERRHEEQEKKRLLWGIGALGSVVMTLGSVIWNYRAVIFK